LAKLAAAKKIGVPVPSPVPADVTHLVVYYGVKGFAPSYSQANRIEIAIGSVAKQTVNNVSYFVFDTKVLPSLADGDYDLYFTLEDATDAEEGDFSPVVTVPLDTVPPVRLAQPVVLA
jgi:hypothetical protein